jgi:glucoamylase
VQRYLSSKSESPYAIWRFNHKCRTFLAGKTLRIERLIPTIVHWGTDNWQTVNDSETYDTGLGAYVTNLQTAGLFAGTQVRFKFHSEISRRWEGMDFLAKVE